MEVLRFIQDLAYKGLEKFGKYYSSYRGFVVDREDPEGYGRVKVKVPDVYGKQLYDYWAWPKNCFAGKDYGFQLIPQKGEMVWVEFELGDARRPIWSFGHFGKSGNTKEKPTEIASNYDLIWFKTPKGNTIEIDDKEGIIRFTNSKGKVIELNDNISIGSKSQSSEAAVLGDKNADALNGIADKINTLCDKLRTYAETQSGVCQGPLAPLQAGYQTLNLEITTIQTTLVDDIKLLAEKSKSLTVTID
jgi:hypothetical protein